MRTQNGFILVSKNNIPSHKEDDNALALIDSLSYAVVPPETSILVLKQRSPPGSSNKIPYLNEDILLQIMDYCSVDTLQACRLVNTQLYKLASLKLFRSHPLRSKSLYLQFLKHFNEITPNYHPKGCAYSVFLKNLIITQSYQSLLLNANVLTEIVIKCVNLRHVELTGISQESFGSLDESISLLLIKRPHVTTLKLNNCSLLSDKAFTSLLNITSSGRRLQLSLRHVELLECRGITNDSVLALCRLAPQISTFSISVAKHVSGISLRKILQMQSLTEVSISHCGRIDDKDLRQVISEYDQNAFCYKLKSIHLVSNYGCISREGFIEFITYMSLKCYGLNDVTIVLPMRSNNNGVHTRPLLLSDSDIQQVTISSRPLVIKQSFT